MKRLGIIVCLLLAAMPMAAQMTVDQRVFDFQVLASLYAKRYGPLGWKREVINVDVLNIAPWLVRVRAAKDDVEFLEICKEYVSSFQDSHSTFNGPGDLIAYTGLFTDIYDGKVYVEGIIRTLLPRAQYPIDIGDEVISVDGKPVATVLAEFIRLTQWGNPIASRRYAADLISFRSVADLPATVRLGATQEIELKQLDGETRKFTLPWTKEGWAPEKIGPVPSPKITGVARGRAALADGEEMGDPADLLLKTSRMGAELRAPHASQFVRRNQIAEEFRDNTEGYLLGFGSRAPTFTLPTGFQQRLGRSAADHHFSGIYQSEGKRIGYLRIPHFSPDSIAGAQREFAAEIAFFRLNTDGMVLDVQRNNGGFCDMVMSSARYLIPRRFVIPGEELRPTADLVGAFANTLDLAKLLRVEPWLINTIEFQLGMIRTAYNENRGTTGSIPGCAWTFENEPATDSAGRVIAYEKPMIVLVDEFSTSAADLLPAILQDNRRAPLVGVRTNGAGGSVLPFDAGFYMESFAYNTNSLIVRNEPRAIQGYPVTAYIENVGVHPDIALDRMTVENLRGGSRAFVDAFTKLIVAEINK